MGALCSAGMHDQALLVVTGSDAQLDYPVPRPAFLSAMFSAGQQCGVAAMMPWELTAWHVAPTASGGFDFGVDDPSYKPVQQMVQFMKNKVNHL